MSPAHVFEGEYKIHGSLEDSLLPPLITLHGGPGAGHEYLSPLTKLYGKYGIPIIFYDQLDNLADHLKLRKGGFFIIGQSWGGMLGAVYATPSSPASVPLYVEGNNKLRSELPHDIREALEASNNDSPEYKKVTDPTAYMTMHGPSELVIVGNTKDWEGWKIAHQINVDTLVLNGRYDEMTDLCVEPWFKVIPRVKWVTFENSSYMAH
ncbi:proline-specific peptidase [Hypoxylon sp. NC0597]|nr:proline-specific peptidase [Hypoxylon sp. NC0597]